MEQQSMCRRIAIVLFLSLPLIPTLQGQTMVIGNQAFSLGMSHEEAVKRIPKHYHVSESKNDILIQEKRGDSYEIVGSLKFTNNSLTSMSREWGSFASRSPAGDFAKTLYQAISAANEDHVAVAAVIILKSRVVSPEFGEHKSIQISFGKRQVSIGFGEPGKVQTYISESLEK